MQSFDDDEKAEVMTQLVEVLENIVNDVLKQQTFRHVDVYSVPTDADDLPEVSRSAHYCSAKAIQGLLERHSRPARGRAQDIVTRLQADWLSLLSCIASVSQTARVKQYS